MPRSPFLNSVREQMLVKNYTKRTVDSYLYWIKYFMVFYKKQHSEEIGAKEVNQFLGHMKKAEPPLFTSLNSPQALLSSLEVTDW